MKVLLLCVYENGFLKRSNTHYLKGEEVVVEEWIGLAVVVGGEYKKDDFAFSNNAYLFFS